MYFGRDWKKAVGQARANAQHFGGPRFVFTSTSGGVHIESMRPAGPAVLEVTPDGREIKHDGEYGRWAN